MRKSIAKTKRDGKSLMNEIKIYVPAVPIAKPRGKPIRLGDGTSRVVVSRGHKVNVFMDAVRVAARETYKGPPLGGAFRVDCLWLMPRPQRMIWKKKSMPRAPYVCKPDRDNLDKSILDSLEGILWRNDSQVYDGRLTKLYAAGDEQPHVEITVIRLEADDET